MTYTHTQDTRTHKTHTHTGLAAARLSSPKIIRHQNEFPCFFFFFFFLPLFILFMCWNSGDWLMQLTCSHHEFSLHHYIGTLQEHGSCDYRDGINMHTLTETHTHTQKSQRHINPCINSEERLHSGRCCITSYCSIVLFVAL